MKKTDYHDFKPTFLRFLELKKKKIRKTLLYNSTG